MTTAMSVSYGNAAMPRMNGKKERQNELEMAKKGMSNSDDTNPG